MNVSHRRRTRLRLIVLTTFAICSLETCPPGHRRLLVRPANLDCRMALRTSQLSNDGYVTSLLPNSMKGTLEFRELPTFRKARGRLTAWFDAFETRPPMRATPMAGEMHD